MRRIILSLCFVLALAAPVYLSQSGAAGRSFTITVAAGSFGRHEMVISFDLPEELKDGRCVLRDETGRAVALQVDGGRAAFVLSELKAGATKSYRLEASQAPRAEAAQGVEAVRTAEGVFITAAGRPVLTYRAGPGELPSADVKPIFRRGGYIHPVYTPSGRIITDDYPEDHRHHHGIWFAWTRTEFDGRRPDFWNMGDGTGKVEFVSLDETWRGPVHAGLRAHHRYVDLSGPQPAAVLNEEWRVTVYNVGHRGAPYTMFDLISTQECATSSPLV
ncbi:MAG TPA: DUF6807 family protein, partial [Blastocatellia bacterium]|nr:DUF6807 family protein [Blastocatellia bacterium]